MNQKAKRFIQNVLMAYAALAVVMALISFGLIPAGMFALIVLDLTLIWVNVSSCRWLLDKAIAVTGIPQNEAYAYYSSILSRKIRYRRRYWHHWVAQRTENFEEFLHWDRFAGYSTMPSGLFLFLSILSVRPGLGWLPNAMLIAIAAYCLVMAYFGFRYHSQSN